MSDQFRKYSITIPVTEDEKDNLRAFLTKCAEIENSCFSNTKRQPNSERRVEIEPFLVA